MGSFKRDELFFGIKRAAPIVMGYMPVSFVLGVMGADIGLSPLQMALMSLVVYAGSAQFIAVDMLGTGIGCLTLIKNKKPPKALMGLFFCQIYQIYLAECCGMCYDISNTRGGCL